MIEYNTEIKSTCSDKRFDYYDIIFRLNNEEVDYYNSKFNNTNLAEFFASFYEKEQIMKKELKEKNKRFKLSNTYYEFEKGEFDFKSDRGYVYEIINKINGRRYIGRSICPLKRIREHIIRQENKPLKKDMIIYGLINFDVIYDIYDDYKQVEKDKISMFRGKPELVYNRSGIYSSYGSLLKD